MGIVEFNSESFEKEVIKSNSLILVDFTAEWCAPCKIIAPIVEEVAKEYSDKLKVGRLDVAENQSLAVRFGVMSIPTLVFFKNGEEIKRNVGLVSKEELKEIIKKIIEGDGG